MYVVHYGVVLWCIMIYVVYGGVWWGMVVYDGVWWRMVVYGGVRWCMVVYNNNNNIYFKSNIQCIYEFSGLIMIYTIITVDTHCRNRNIIQII